MKFTEVLNRLTGISCPVFGVSWNPVDTERSIARRIVIFLEPRRVLYSAFEYESVCPCITSITEIKNYLTSELQNIGTSEKRPNLRWDGAKNEGSGRSVVNSLTTALIYIYFSAAIPEKGRNAPIMLPATFARPLPGDRDSRRRTWHTAGFHFSSNPGIGPFGTQIDI